MPNNPNNLVVLARARAFAVDLHRAVERRERLIGRTSPGLRNQMLRASLSIALNVGEGAGKDTRAEFAQFVGHAIGSANEVEQQMLLAQALALFDAEIDPLLDECCGIRMMLYGLRKRLRRIG
ncbi:four helix bundle protein [Gemmatimonas sp.]|uniref:four helix bundle protein n=1 Tax=Gemmatimonas sp. TaxID=1962908 RepID=UPI00286DC203|nr:four helix bundle protein [Gemmatimonas sp.]